MTDFTVPDAARLAAVRALALHHASPIADTQGLRVAKELATGTVNESTVQQMCRFFDRNQTTGSEQARSLLTEDDSAPIRSFLLHGAEAGANFATVALQKLVSEGVVSADPLEDLLTKTPAVVEQNFAGGAWYEDYGLDVRAAGRFVEQYLKVNGNPLDLERVFGESAEAVGNAVYRRFNQADVYEALSTCLEQEGTDYEIAANLDLVEVTHAIAGPMMDESLNWKQIGRLPVNTAAKILWGQLVAYFILAVEDKEKMKEINKGYKLPPLHSQEVKATYQQFTDVTNLILMYFHPQGAHYVDPTGIKGFDGIDHKMLALLLGTFHNLVINKSGVIKTLTVARKWTAKNKFAGSLFNKYITDWSKGDYANILNGIPVDSDVRPQFQAFVDAASPPVADPVAGEPVSVTAKKPVKPKLTNEADITWLNDYLQANFTGVDATDQISFSETLTGKTAFEQGTPIGSHSGIHWSTDQVVMAAVKVPHNVIIVTMDEDGNGQHYPDAAMSIALSKGLCKVTHGHHLYASTAYNNAALTVKKEKPLEAPLLPVVTPSAAPGAAVTPVVHMPHVTPAILSEIEQFLDDQFGEVYKQFKVEPIQKTTTFSAWSEKYPGQYLKIGTKLTRKKDNEDITILAVYGIHDLELTDENGDEVVVNDVIFVVRMHDGDLSYDSDEDFYAHINSGALYFKQAAKAPGAKAKFAPGTIVEGVWKDTNLLVIQAPQGEVTAQSQYVVVPLRIGAEPKKIQAAVLEKGTVVLTDASADVALAHVTYSAPFEDWHVVPESWDVKVGMTMMVNGALHALVGAVVTVDGTVLPMMGLKVTDMAPDGSVSYYRLAVLPADTFAKQVKSSYAPEADHAPDVPGDPEPMVPAPENCGTKEAISHITKLGWKYAVKSDNSAFTWDLGDVLAYGQTTKQRIIVGYALNPSGAPHYIILTETGAYNFKTTLNGNKDYGPKLSSSQKVVDALLPKPGTAAAVSVPKTKFPKLNYTLSTLAIKLAKEHGFVYVNAPDAWPQYTWTRARGPAGAVIKVRGFIADPQGSNLPPQMVVGTDAGYSVLSAADLKHCYVESDYKTTMNPKVIVFGKNPGDEAVSLIAPGDVALPSKMPEGWDAPDAMAQPPFEGLSKGAHASAGIVLVVPPGYLASGTNGAHGSSDPGVVLVHPLNAFGGYKMTFPKGTLDKGESIEVAAVREVYEETGLSSQLLSFLGDYKGTTSVTRMFMGRVTGGDPTKAGTETDAVTIRSLVGFSECTSSDQLGNAIYPLPWFKDLAKRDQKILMDAATWLWVSKSIKDSQKVAKKSQVTLPQDITGTYDPKDKFTMMGQGAFKGSSIDYAVTSAVHAAVMKLMLHRVEAFGAGWFAHMDAAIHKINKGYPPVCAVVSVKGEEGAFIVRGYCSAYSEDSMHSRDYVVLQDGNGDVAVRDLYHMDDGDVTSAILLPHDFAPVVTTAATSALMVPADTTQADAWDLLFHAMPFPITTHMVNAIKRHIGKKLIPVSFAGQRSAKGGPKYGTGFITEDKAKYLAAGFITVQTKAADGSTSPEIRLQLAYDQSGDEIVWPGDDYFLVTYLPDFSADAAFKTADPWYKHPDAVVNALIQKLYAMNGDLAGVNVTLAVFKDGWLSSAKVPNCHYVTANIAGDVASLFVPGAAPKIVHDAVMDNLKKRAAMEQAKGKPDDVPAAMPLPVAKVTVTMAPTVTVQVTDYTGSSMKGLLLNVHGSTLTISGSVGGGSKPNHIGVDKQGRQWFLKPAPGPKEVFRPYTDRAAFQLCELIKGNNIPVAVTDLKGTPASIQPLVPNAKVLSQGDQSGLSESDIGEVLAQHVADMFIGDHDGHFGNWLRDGNGKLLAIDKGQAFKFILQDVSESLDPAWHAPGNFGTHLAKKLLLDWAKNKQAITPAAFKAMKVAIDKVGGISAKTLTEIVTAWSDNSKLGDDAGSKVYKALSNRQKAYLKEWTTVMTNLASARGETWKWPETGATVKAAPKIEQMPLDKVAEGMAFTKTEAQSIAEAVGAKWAGKSIRVDRDAIENQEVIVKRVKYSSATSPEKHATMIHFRVSRSRALQAESVLGPKAKVVTKEVGSGPKPLHFDEFYNVIFVAAKSINYHIYGKPEQGVKPDGKPNPNSVKNAQMLLPKLEQLKEQTKNPKGSYQGVSNEAVNLMANNYIGYIETILKYAASAEQLIGQKMEPTFQFVWQEKAPEPGEEKEDNENIHITKHTKSAFSPSSSFDADEVAIKGSDVPMHMAEGKQSQYMIEVKQIPGARLYFCPAKSEYGEGVRSYFGQAWGVIPGTPTPAQVAILLQVFEKATGIDMKVASKHDREYLMLAKQAYLLNDSGDGVKPDDNGEISRSGDWAKAHAAYESGNAAEAVKILKGHVAARLGVAVDTLSSDPHYSPEHQHERGVGFGRHYRMGWTRTKLQKLFGSNCYLAHHLYSTTIVNFFNQVVPHNGALLSNAVRPFSGVPIGGSSEGADLLSGGGVNLFAVLRKGFVQQQAILYFDISILLRDDIFLCGTGDTFGRDTERRYLTPESWKKAISGYTGSIGASSHNQFVVRHSIDLRHYLHTAICENESERDKIRELCTDHGWTTFANGRSLEQVIVTRSEAGA